MSSQVCNGVGFRVSKVLWYFLGIAHLWKGFAGMSGGGGEGRGVGVKELRVSATGPE